MSDPVAYHQETLPNGEACFVISLQAPRANALEPCLLQGLHRAFDALERSGAQKALIKGGRNFSTGGDVARFLDAAEQGGAEDYCDQVVPPLQDLIQRLLDMPVVIASAVQGAATGGGAGLIFASDLAVAAPDAFVQPYYSVMGFAPDGGWAVLLPELIGTARARSWVMANQRLGATDLHSLGLVQDVSPLPSARARHLLSEIDTDMALAAKALLWDEVRRARLRAGLAAEAAAFRRLIGQPTTRFRMREFLQRTG